MRREVRFLQLTLPPLLWQMIG